MFFYLSKLLEFITDPFIWVFILLISALFKLKETKARRSLIGALIILYFFSNRAIFFEFSNAWEMEIIPVEALEEKYEVAIVLGGLASIEKESKQIQFHGNADRILNILPLYFEGRVKKILLSGGSGRIIEAEKEATILEDYLLKIGVKEEDLLIEDQSRNTHENATYTAALIKELNLEGSILLSTSATHMKRAYLCFQKQGLEVQPFPVDKEAYQRELYFNTLFIPSSYVLNNWYWLIHEWIGLLTYRLMGYC